MSVNNLPQQFLNKFIQDQYDRIQKERLAKFYGKQGK